MSTESDPLRRDLDRLRRLKGLSPLTPEAADAELSGVPDVPLSSEEIERLIAAATTGTRGGASFPEQEWDSDEELAGVGAGDETADYDRHALLLNRAQEERNEGLAEDSEEPCDGGPAGDKEDEPPDDASPSKPGT
jgi:hypothetical protein